MLEQKLSEQKLLEQKLLEQKLLEQKLLDQKLQHFNLILIFLFTFFYFFYFPLSIPPMCMSSSASSFRFVDTKQAGRNKDLMTKSNFSTWDPRKLGKPGAADPLGPQYDEIPYGDVPPPHIAGAIGYLVILGA